MTINPLKARWQAGKVAIGTFILYSRDIATIEIAAAAGLDFVVFDLEHRAHHSETVHDLVQVSRMLGMAALLGPSHIQTHAISHGLDLGASGIVLPHVETAEEVKLAANAVRYAPRGKRGRSNIAGHNLYVRRPTAVEVEEYNAEVSLLLKVESEAAIRNLDELVDSDEVDGVMMGPSDLAVDIGIPGEVKHERIAKLTQHVRDVCRRRQIQYGTAVHSPDDVQAAMEEGATWIIVGSDIDFLLSGWKRSSEARKQIQAG
jgi:2-keto-3-deoxy-L-rhamnonate aldolase RhmA